VLRGLKAKFPVKAGLKPVFSRAKREYPVEKSEECV